MNINVKKLHNNATVPKRATPHSAGLDLYALEDSSITPGKMILVKTGIAVQIPEGFYGQVAMRSGHALKYGLATTAGVIDSDYRGDVGVMVFTVLQESYLIKAGERFAQLILIPILHHGTNLVEEFVEKERFHDGHTGYGSTGKQ